MFQCISVLFLNILAAPWFLVYLIRCISKNYLKTSDCVFIPRVRPDEKYKYHSKRHRCEIHHRW
ncbi:hypothetical protein KQQSB11_220135 [Klebsiella quasipneumoniae subsp. quasipneumoniae]|nr:hypothetical protein KQQSB11_220135 [Klebsiella quasipneumoniae subsp. quasipneumoniae]